MIDMREVLDHYGIFWEEKTKGHIDILCPFHEDLHLGNARYDVKKDIFKCFACGKGHSLFTFVKAMEGETNNDYIEKLIASNFTYKGEGYDINVLSKFLERQKSRKGFKNEIIKRCIDNILGTMSRKKLEACVISKWIPILSYINYYTSWELNKEEVNQIVNIYTLFFKELNTENL
jgi:hypothetical protein